jgi:nucleoid-associated protein YgaU
MFNTQDTDSYYSEAVKDAVINRDKQSNNTIFLISSLLALVGVSFFGYKFFNESNENKIETKVLGVTHVAQKGENMSDNIDVTSEIEKIDKETSDSEYSTQLQQYISQEMEHPNAPNRTSKDDFTIIVQKGDTLASLAKKYYNDPRAYEIIIENNKEAFKKSRTIYPGQELIISHRY